MTDTFDPTKPVRLRNGWKAGIYSTNNGGEYPIHGWYEDEDGIRHVGEWLATGEYSAPMQGPSRLDFINISPAPKYADPPREIEMVQFVQENGVGASGVYHPMEAVSMMRLCEHRILRYVLAEGQG
jgi:hypothetical protein